MKSLKAGQDRGVALFLVIVALLIVTAVAGGMIILSSTETNVDYTYRDEQASLYAAKAGLEEVRDRMLSGNANPLTLPTVLPGGAGAYCLYVYTTGASPWLAAGPYEDTEYMSEMGLSSPPSGTTWYTASTSQTSYNGPSTNPLPYRWVRLNLKIDRSAYTSNTPYYVDGTAGNASKQVCYDTVNLHETVISAASCSAASANYQPVYVITSYAQSSYGTHRMLQAEATKEVVNLALPGAVTFDGPIPSTACGNTNSVFPGGSTCNSSGDYINGNNPTGTDANIPACAGGSSAPAFAVPDATSVTNISTLVNANKSQIVGSPAGPPSVGNASAALTNLTTPAQIEALVSQMKGLAGSNVGCDATKLNLGTAANPTITVVTNDGVSGTGSGCPSSSAMQLNSGTTGFGILVVTGELDYVNINSYEGVILMLGTAQFIETSSKDTTFTGALFMAKDRCDASGDSAPAGVTCTKTGQAYTGNTLGTPSFNYHHGNASASDVSIQYDSCIISQAETGAVSSYRVLSQRELMF